MARVHWKDWCWNWNSNTLATWYKELTHWERPWCWEGLGAGGEGDDRGWDGWMASPTRWTWVWVNSGSWWWTGRPGMLQFMGVSKSQTRLSDWTELNWTEPNGETGIENRLMDMEKGEERVRCMERVIWKPKKWCYSEIKLLDTMEQAKCILLWGGTWIFGDQKAGCGRQNSRNDPPKIPVPVDFQTLN